MNKRLFFILGAIALAGVKCHDGCDVNSTKCDDGAVYVCNADQNWELSIDCQELSGSDIKFECCLDDDGDYSCLPKTQCELAGEDYD